MKRKTLFFTLLFIILSFVAFLGYKTYKNFETKKTIASKIHKLPSLPFQFLNPVHDLSNKSVIVNYFSPDCDHCQYMVKQFILNKNAFANAQIIMITADKMEAVKKFNKDFGLESLSFINLGFDTSYLFYKIFESASVPSFYIYNSKHELVKTIVGETKIENIINAIE